MKVGDARCQCPPSTLGMRCAMRCLSGQRRHGRGRALPLGTGSGNPPRPSVRACQACTALGIRGIRPSMWCSTLLLADSPGGVRGNIRLWIELQRRAPCHFGCALHCLTSKALCTFFGVAPQYPCGAVLCTADGTHVPRVLCTSTETGAIISPERLR